MQAFKIVIGYLPRVDRLPHEAQRLGFTHRFAFVLESYEPGCPEDFFDAALYEGLVNVVCRAVGGDTIRIVVSRQEPRDVSPKEFHRILREVPEAEREPFPRLVVLRRTSPVAVIASEPWTHVGGPDVYHDSYTLAVFTASDLSDRLTEEARTYAEKTGAEISDIVQFERTPPKPSLLSHLKRLISRRYQEV